MSPGGGPAVTTAPGPPGAGAAVGRADWTTYQHDAARTGRLVSTIGPNLRRAWADTSLDGAVYAQPLLVGSQVVVATEQNSLYSLDEATGAVRWKTNFGLPVFGDQLPCGDVDPVGITGTPVIDATAGIVWAVPFIQPGKYELVAVDLATGALRATLPIAPAGFDPIVENQRAALTLANGRVYVPFGGRYGDCGAYHGWMVAASATPGAGPLLSWQVPTGREGGIWSPAGAAVDPSGDLDVATGNSASSTTYDDGNSVIRLSPTLAPLETFAPTSWAAANADDADLGSTGPTPVDGARLFQVGKTGFGYLLNDADLGGIGGSVAEGRVCPGGGAFGANASTPPIVLVACTDGLTAVRVGAGSGTTALQIAWRGPGTAMGPPIVTGSVVWAVDLGHGQLLAFDLTGGKVLARLAVAHVPHFAAPGAGDGLVVVPSGHGVVAFAE